MGEQSKSDADQDVRGLVLLLRSDAQIADDGFAHAPVAQQNVVASTWRLLDWRRFGVADNGERVHAVCVTDSDPIRARCALDQANLIEGAAK